MSWRTYAADPELLTAYYRGAANQREGLHALDGIRNFLNGHREDVRRRAQLRAACQAGYDDQQRQRTGIHECRTSTGKKKLNRLGRTAQRRSSPPSDMTS